MQLDINLCARKTARLSDNLRLSNRIRSDHPFATTEQAYKAMIAVIDKSLDETMFDSTNFIDLNIARINIMDDGVLMFLDYTLQSRMKNDTSDIAMYVYQLREVMNAINTKGDKYNPEITAIDNMISTLLGFVRSNTSQNGLVLAYYNMLIVLYGCMNGVYANKMKNIYKSFITAN